MRNIIKSALIDFEETLKIRRVWYALAVEDIKDEHKRTSLGPFWLLINYVAFVGTFCFVVFSGNSAPNYVPFVAVGLFIWFYMSECINNSVGLFIREEGFIKGTPLPISLYIMRQFMQTCIRSFYALIGCVVILFVAGLTINWGWALSLASILLILFATPPVITVFAFLGGFFPDAKFLMQNAMRIGMFLTPVFWNYEHSGGIRHYFYWWNPFTYFLEIVREPILFGYIPLFALGITLLISAAMWIVAIFLLGKFKSEVVFVL